MGAGKKPITGRFLNPNVKTGGMAPWVDPQIFQGSFFGEIGSSNFFSVLTDMSIFNNMSM